MQIQGRVHLMHRKCVMNMLPVLGKHLTRVPVTRPAATGVCAIKDSSEMGLPAPVSHNRLSLKTLKNGVPFVTFWINFEIICYFSLPLRW